jgi:two-component system, cell cycle response regulator DivK
MSALSSAQTVAASGDSRKARVPHLSPLRPAGAGAEGEALATVLIAEDHEDSRDALQTLLEAMGYRVVTADNGARAVDVARAERPDLVLLDMMMPEVDGFHAARTLRADPSFDAVPIIAITALEGARPEVLAAGCDDCVVKPIDIRAFLQKVPAWLAAGHTPHG